MIVQLSVRRDRSGLTIIETIVVISILAILIALTFPALQRVRETARKTTCQNNLRQIGLAVQQHHAAFNAMPNLHNGTFHQSPITYFDSFHSHSWRSAILPRLGENNVFEALSFDSAATATKNQPPVNTVIGTFLCPSTPNTSEIVSGVGKYNGGGPPIDNDNTLTAARSDYEAIGGIRQHLRPQNSILDGVQLGAWKEPTYRGATPTKFNTGRFAQIADGLSNTILAAERVGRPDIHQSYEPKIIPFSSDPNDPGWAENHQAAWGVSTHFNNLVLDKIPVNENNQYGIFAYHTGGANILLTDGSVRLLSDSTDIDIIAALITRAGGESDRLD
ncbi:DUF1559 domain-containing protein [Mariniblastus sp.]|nr:DUF1559 domain-containing protein [Mariniblastus sp.]